MIASLNGTVDSLAAGHAVIDVGGVGYLVFASGRTLGALPAAGNPAKLLIETHVREDHIHLYGFADADERAWFRLLTTVQGVGARVALAILSVLAPADLAVALAAQDKGALTRADGVGPKLAQRILSELKDKAGDLALGATLGGGTTAPTAGAPIAKGPAQDAVSALVNLGYGRSEAFSAVNAAMAGLGDGVTTESLIREGLKELAK